MAVRKSKNRTPSPSEETLSPDLPHALPDLTEWRLEPSKLAALRNARGISQTAAARAVGLTAPARLWDIENGRTYPTGQVLCRLLVLYEVLSPADAALLSGIDAPAATDDEPPQP